LYWKTGAKDRLTFNNAGCYANNGTSGKNWNSLAGMVRLQPSKTSERCDRNAIQLHEEVTVSSSNFQWQVSLEMYGPSIVQATF
jgi:hypothetical protein